MLIIVLCSYPAVLVIPQATTDDSVNKFARAHRQNRLLRALVLTSTGTSSSLSLSSLSVGWNIFRILVRTSIRTIASLFVSSLSINNIVIFVLIDQDLLIVSCIINIIACLYPTHISLFCSVPNFPEPMRRSCKCLSDTNLAFISHAVSLFPVTSVMFSWQLLNYSFFQISNCYVASCYNESCSYTCQWLPRQGSHGSIQRPLQYTLR